MIEPIVTIITPTYHRVSTGELDRCIKSVDEQIDTRWVHIIVGDGCEELAKYTHKLETHDKYVKSGQRIIVNLEKTANDLGVTPLNHGLSLVKTPYYEVLADDNIIYPHHLATLIEFALRNPEYDIVFGNTIIKHKNIPEYFRIRVNDVEWNRIDLGDSIYRIDLWRKRPYVYVDRSDLGEVKKHSPACKYSYDWHFIYDSIKDGAKYCHLNFDPSVVFYVDEKNGPSPEKFAHNWIRLGAQCAGDGGCAYYRLKYPLTWMVRNQSAFVNYYKPHVSPYAMETWFHNQEVVLFQGIAHFETADLINKLKTTGKVCIADVDDWVFGVDYDNETYSRFGVKNVKFKFNDKAACLNHLQMWRAKTINDGGDYAHIDTQIQQVEAKPENNDFVLQLLTHGIDGFDVNKNARLLMAAEACYRAVDGIQCTTDYLAKQLSRFTENTFVFPNCLDFKTWDKDLKFIRTDNKIRILWTGGSSHLVDLMIVRDALLDVLKRHPECIFVCAGFSPNALTRVFPSKQIETHEWHDFIEHPYKLHRMRGDIGIIPLRDTEFARCKSNIKWVELSGLGIPCVVSNSIVYNGAIESGYNGFLFNTPEQFTEQLETLINDVSRRNDMGIAANEYVRANNDIEKWAPRLLRWYEIQWLKKNIRQPEKNTLIPVLKTRLEKELGHPINSEKALDGVV